MLCSGGDCESTSNQRPFDHVGKMRMRQEAVGRWLMAVHEHLYQTCCCDISQQVGKQRSIVVQTGARQRMRPRRVRIRHPSIHQGVPLVPSRCINSVSTASRSSEDDLLWFALSDSNHSSGVQRRRSQEPAPAAAVGRTDLGAGRGECEPMAPC